MRTSERFQPDLVESPAHHALGVRHRFAYTAVCEHLALDAQVLDVGCGEGYGAEILGPHVASYIGVDVASDAVEAAASRYAGKKAAFDVYDGKKLPYDDRRFDAVTSFQVIEHVVDVPRYLAEIHRVLAPGGSLFLTTPNRLVRLKPGERPWNRHHLREYDPKGLEDELAAVFESVDVRGVRGPAEMEELERRRVARAQTFARFDRLGLRYALPDRLNTTVRWLLRGAHRGGRSAPSAFGVADVYLTAHEVADCFDLFAQAHGAPSVSAA